MEKIKEMIKIIRIIDLYINYQIFYKEILETNIPMKYIRQKLESIYLDKEISDILKMSDILEMSDIQEMSDILVRIYLINIKVHIIDNKYYNINYFFYLIKNIYNIIINCL